MSRRTTLAAAALLALALPTPALVAATSTAAEPSTTTSATSATTAFTVDDAQLRWGLNDESNNRAFAPGTINFLSAGAVPDPGRGGQRITDGTWTSTGARAWRARQGDVRVEKLRPDGTYAAATFAGLSRTVAGSPMVGTNGPFSEHQVVLDGGTGTVDPDSGTAVIRWTGTFSVVYYSGLTFFTVTDPVLRVADGTATLRATLGGYASDMEDTTAWAPVPARTVTVATVTSSRVRLPDEGGVTLQPDYRGVRHAAPASATPQVRSGADWGSFPASFLGFMTTVGSGSYWYSSGGSADAHKVADPLTVSYAAGDPVDVPTDPGDGATTPAVPPTTVALPPPPPAAPAAPTTPAAPTVPVSPVAPASPAPAPPTAPAVDAALPAALDPRLATGSTVHALTTPTASPLAPAGPDSDHPWTWWLGSVLLLGAAALTLHRNRSRGTP